MTKVRRPGGLGKDPVRARQRADALTAIDPDWNPSANGWTVDWQRHYAYLAEGARLTAICDLSVSCQCATCTNTAP